MLQLTLPQQRGLPRAHRPAEVSLWIQNAREKPLAVENATAYERDWWQWWDGMNPSWRTRVDGRLQQGGNGDWSCFYKSGPNGFLSVLMSLAALQHAADDLTWRDALADVHWVLGEVVLALCQDSPS